MQAQAQATQAAHANDDGLHEERRNVTNLIRMLGLFAAVPGLSISLILLAIDVQEHLGHFLLLFPVGLAGILAMVMAPRLAAKWVKGTG